jgi:hypothetical protein
MKSLCKKCSSKILGKANFGAKNGMCKGIGEMPYRYITDIQNHAKANGRECSISMEDLYSKYNTQNGKCAYSGVTLSFVNRGRNYRVGNASVDRIDSNLGYIKNNIQWVDKDINKMKSNFNSDYFIETCRKIADNIIETPIDIFIKNNKSKVQPINYDIQ